MNILLAVPATDVATDVAEPYVRLMLRALVALYYDAAAIGMGPHDAARIIDAAERARAHLVLDGSVLAAFPQHAGPLAALGATALIHHLDRDGDHPGPRDARALLAAMPRVIATSEAARARLIGEFGIEGPRIRVVPPGTDPAPRAPGSGGPGCHVLSLGPLVLGGGFGVLIRALARLTDLDWRLTVAGDAHDGAQARDLRVLAQEARNVTLVEDPDEATRAALWDTADLFALAGPTGAPDMLVAEALSRGVPVCVAEGCGSALVPPGGGIVTPAGDADALSKAMRRLVFSPELRASYAAAAHAAGALLPDWATQARLFAAAIGA